MTQELSSQFLDFLIKAGVAGTGSFLVSIILSARHTKPKLDRRKAISNLLRQLAIAAISGLIVAGIPGIKDLAFAFAGGLFFPMIWDFILNPIKERVELENTRATELRDNLVKAEAAIEKEPEKAKPLWDLSRASLELYIRKNQSQVGSIYWFTLIVMGAGYILILIGVWHAINGWLDAAVLSAIAGVVTQAIGASFLLIYKSTIGQATAYVGMLERINSVGMAVQIVDMIPEEKGDLKNKARVDLVKQILSLSKTPHHE
jgi:hypothetical protein